MSINASTTLGSANVLVSPRLSVSCATILRRMRRIILPERVMGRDGVTHKMSGAAKGPISSRTWLRNYDVTFVVYARGMLATGECRHAWPWTDKIDLPQ